MLKLVVDNRRKKSDKNTVTCRNSCDLFDEITGKCSINKNLNVDSPYETARCGFFLERDSMVLPIEHTRFKFSLMEEESDELLDDEEIFHQLMGKSVYKETYTYPMKPDFSSNREDANWFVSPCETYGCWIVNLYRKPMIFPKNKTDAEKGWSNKVYKAPIPLHDHKSSVSIASKMAWVVDEDGYGQYGLLVNGKISTISSPRPANWQK